MISAMGGSIWSAAILAALDERFYLSFRRSREVDPRRRARWNLALHNERHRPAGVGRAHIILSPRFPLLASFPQISFSLSNQLNLMMTEVTATRAKTQPAAGQSRSTM